MWYERKDRHFRRKTTITKCKKKRRPNYIIGEEDKDYLYLGLTHDNKKGSRHHNHQLFKNPDNSVTSKEDYSYIRKQVEHAAKARFGKVEKDFHMSSEDDDYVDRIIEKRINYAKNNKK